mmetsp:Transcript_47409/g.132118  ORF Transcript_47409/g.132118 Transcript_47409/m.132118 type:complete len:222 (+) Transcript_47409:201-866(+)
MTMCGVSPLRSASVAPPARALCPATLDKDLVSFAKLLTTLTQSALVQPILAGAVTPPSVHQRTKSFACWCSVRRSSSPLSSSSRRTQVTAHSSLLSLSASPKTTVSAGPCLFILLRWMSTTMKRRPVAAFILISMSLTLISFSSSAVRSMPCCCSSSMHHSDARFRSFCVVAQVPLAFMLSTISRRWRVRIASFGRADRLSNLRMPARNMAKSRSSCSVGR